MSLEGDHIKVTASKYPFPTVCADKQSTDWFHAISRTLKWNERERQKSFVVVEEGPVKRKKHKLPDDNDPSKSRPDPVEEEAPGVGNEELIDEDDAILGPPPPPPDPPPPIDDDFEFL